ARHRDHAALVRGVVELRLDVVAGAAGTVARARTALVLCVGTAALDHEARDHAVERRAVVEALPREVEEVLHVAGGLVGHELQLDSTELRLDDGVGRGFAHEWTSSTDDAATLTDARRKSH